MGEPSLEALITAVETTAPADAPLDRLARARGLADALRARSEELLDHFVDAAREADCSWTEIGCALRVTKQAAQQRYVALTPPAPGELPPGLRGPAADVLPRSRFGGTRIRSSLPASRAPRARTPHPAR